MSRFCAPLCAHSTRAQDSRACLLERCNDRDRALGVPQRSEVPKRRFTARDPSKRTQNVQNAAYLQVSLLVCGSARMKLCRAQRRHAQRMYRHAIPGDDHSGDAQLNSATQCRMQRAARCSRLPRYRSVCADGRRSSRAYTC
ncbi:hypothetical protein FKP32DRAFT_44457 [Trametes sanguinea]|nr:hypothetical protein FKP32DRAFT_44457 [Trametes sanguinea]